MAVAHTTASDTLQMVNQLSELYGTPAYGPDDVPHMLKGITAYSMQVTSLEGKFNLGQNRPLADRINMRQQLAAAEADTATADFQWGWNNHQSPEP